MFCKLYIYIYINIFLSEILTFQKFNKEYKIANDN